MRRKGLFILLIFLCIGLITACGTEEGPALGADDSETLSITHELGQAVVKKSPETVVVFDFGALDTLDELGVDVTGVPKASLPSYLAHYDDDKYTNVGGLKEPDFEKINALKPDLILISGRQADLYDEFKAIGPTVYIGLDTSRYMDSFKENATLLGEIFEKETEVKDALSQIETDIESLHAKTAASDEIGLIVLTTGGKVSAFGPGSRFGIIHDVFGVKPADEGLDISTHGNSVSFEYIAQKNPDYLFVIDRDAVVDGGDSSAKDVIENALVENTNAYKNGNIVYLDPNYWYLSGGGFISVREMVAQISAGIE